MSQSHWMDQQIGNFSNDKKDTFDPAKNYLGVRLQQGVPFLDRDWNEFEDMRRYSETTLKRHYIGNGAPLNGFEVSTTAPASLDFKISAGRCMVDGFDVLNDPPGEAQFILYSQQEQKVDLAAAKFSGKDLYVYIDAWITEINAAIDPALANSQDIDVETSVRHKLNWLVRVAVTANYKNEPYHHYYTIAKIKKEADNKSIKQITDLRVSGISLSNMKKTITATSTYKLTGPGGTPDNALVVDATGNSNIASGSLFFGATVRQMINLWSTGYGIGVQNGTLYFRTDKNVAFYKTGKHTNTELDAGGGSPMLVIKDGNVGIGTNKPTAKLQVSGGAIMPAAGKTENTGILFPKNAFGGSGDSAWMRYYARKGESSTLELGTANDADDHIALMPSGNVGIGTNEPKAKLDVAGGIYAGNSDLYFTRTDHNHSAIGNTKGYAAIENAKDHNALMILGRAGEAKGRTVRLWDYLEVNGALDVTGTTYSKGGYKFGDNSVQSSATIIKTGFLSFGECAGVKTLTQTVKISGFTKTPQVFVAISSADVDQGRNLRIITEASKITKTSFVVTVRSWADTILYSSRISWIAISS
jgi:H-type lectin domain/Family of unknown function (DUF6519)